MLTNAAGILRWIDLEGTDYFELWPRFKMKTPETLNTKRVDIFLMFPSNICMPCSNKQSNGYSHWKTAWGDILTEIWKQIEFPKTEEDSVREQNHDNKLKTRMLCNHSWLGSLWKQEYGTLELRSSFNGKRPLTRKDWIGKLWRSGRSSLMKDAFRNWRKTWKLGSLEYLKSDSDRGKR
jgi:hypothetical protein